MKRIELSKDAKRVFRLALCGQRTCPDHIFPSQFSKGARELYQKGLLYIHEEEGGEVLVISITDSGRLYVEINPKLHNPIDWKWIITTTLLAITAVTGIVALFVACSIGAA